MSQYGDVAKLAVELLEKGEADNPPEAWEKSAKKLLNTVELQKKGCPKNSFLGLCNEGLIKGISTGNYSKPSKNGEYAVEAISILKANRFLASQPEMLWKKVAGKTKSPNHQMDVVVSLWESEKIIT